MPNPRLALRYAKSLLELAIEQGSLDAVFNDMQLFRAICKSNRDFVNLLRSPIINADLKRKIVETIIKGKVNELSSAFVRLLITKGRESSLPEIITSFISQYKDYKNIYTVKLTTAIPASEVLKNAVVDHLKKTTKMKQIELETEVKEEIIGGFVLQAGDQLVDASIAYDLKEIARQFENNDFIYKIR